MSRHSGDHRLVELCLVVVLAVAGGCTTLPVADWLRGAPTVSRDEVERTRDLWRKNADPAAIRWLLTHEVRSGMSLAEVEQAIGHSGVREHRDTWVKGDEAGYQVGDETYKWGPDTSGRSYYLLFRSGRLVNFDPTEFGEGSA
jgi:hypothetical protein